MIVSWWRVCARGTYCRLACVYLYMTAMGLCVSCISHLPLVRTSTVYICVYAMAMVREKKNCQLRHE